MRSLFRALSLCTLCILATGCGDGKKEGDDKNDNTTDGALDPVRIDNYPTFATTSDEPVLLRYKMKTGQTLKLAVDIDMSMAVNQSGQKMTMNMPIVMEATAVVTAVDGQGNMSVDVKITRMKMKMDMSGPQSVNMNYDSNDPGGDPRLAALGSLINVNLPCRITPTGQLLESDIAPLIQALDRAGNAALATSMKDSLSQLVEGTFVQLSEKPVKAGETYKGGTLKMGGGKANVSYKIRSVSGDKKQAVLEPIAEFDFTGGLVPGAEVKLKKQNFGGWMLFDVEKGYASKGEGQINMLLDFKAQGQSGTMIMKGKTVVTQTLQ